MAFDSVTDIAQQIIDRYKLRNPNSYEGGEEALNREYLEDLIYVIFETQLKTNAEVSPGSFQAGGDAVSGSGGPLN